MVKAHTYLKQPPWNVERCDQIVIAKRKMIPDHEDFTKRRDIVITITAYYINLKFLIKSIIISLFKNYLKIKTI